MSTLRNPVIVAVCGFWFGALAAPSAHAQDRELGAGGEVLEGVAAVVDDGVVL